ncbi:MAG: hypothetical protein RMX96_32215 [Nostoc sp. ChiSLP02]|nr:hypothetical protein [Nostoc sp. DedSLP05]MDZ8100970.1 hypothetical protein [Nostoc sp. DedSLP01]MDZ8189490.1 hypothetical protein [Nostoc sp. ChiSLP02]
MKNHEEGFPSAVIAAIEVFVSLKLANTGLDKIEKISLEYAVIQKQFEEEFFNNFISSVYRYCQYTTWLFVEIF